MKKKLFFTMISTLLCTAGSKAQPIRPVSVSASSYVTLNVKREQHHPELTIDGKTGNIKSYWASDFKNAAPRPHWLELDFGKEVSFNSIRLDMIETSDLGRILNNFEIEVCGENGQYRQIVEEKNIHGRFAKALQETDFENRYAVSPPNAHPCYRFPTVSARKVKLIIHDSIARLDEISVGMDLKEDDADHFLPLGVEIPAGARCFSFAPPAARIIPGFEHGQLNGKAKIVYCDRTRPDALRRYFARGSGAASLKVPLAAGWYDVFVMSGDSALATPGAQLRLNNHPLTLPEDPKYCFFWDIRSVYVDQQLEMAIDGDWLLNTMIISPRSEHEKFLQLVDRVVVGSVFASLKADPQPTHSIPPELNSSEQQKGFILYTPSLQQRIFQETTPLAEQRVERLRGGAPANSLKALSLALYANQDLPDLRLDIDELRRGDNVLKATLHPIRRWIQRSGHKGSARIYARVPELLEDNHPIFVGAKNSQQFYLIVELPSDAAPGLYKGNISIRKGTQEVALLPLEFTVHPFILPDLDGARQYTAMYNADKHRPFLRNPNFRDFDLLRLADLKRHNMNSVLFPSTAYKSREDFEELYLHVNRLLDEAGFPKLPMAYHNGNLTVQDVTDIRDIVSKHGQREILFYPVDEPHFNKRDLAIKLYAEAKQVPGIRTYCTVSQDDVDIFGENIDFRTYMITGYAKFEPDRIREECARNNKIFWWYSNAAREYPAANRYKAGFFQYRAGASGQLYWAYDNLHDDPYNDFDGRANDHLAVYIIGGRIYSTLQWEAIREGIDDLRHCYFLEDLLKKPQADPEAVRQAQSLLAEIKRETVIDLKVFKEKFGADIEVHHHSIWEPERFDHYRDAITKMILKLR